MPRTNKERHKARQDRHPIISGWSPLEEVEQELFPGKTSLSRHEWQQLVAAAKDRFYKRTGHRIEP